MCLFSGNSSELGLRCKTKATKNTNENTNTRTYKYSHFKGNAKILVKRLYRLVQATEEKLGRQSCIPVYVICRNRTRCTQYDKGLIPPKILVPFFNLRNHVPKMSVPAGLAARVGWYPFRIFLVLLHLPASH